MCDREPVGFANEGNTCFLNSAVQSLLACEACHDAPSPVRDTHAEIVARRARAPMALRSLVAGSFPRFRNLRQHDAHEWLLTLMDRLETSSPDLVKSFQGKWTVLVRFPECGHTNEHQETFQSLSLSLPQPGGDMNEALTGLGREEEVRSTCDACADGEMRRALKSIRVDEWPRHLVCHLKRFRFQGMGRKIDQRVPTPLTIEPYRLASMINHRGATAFSGHYTAVVRRGDDWFMCNDHSVMRLEPRHAEKAAELAYVTIWTLGGEGDAADAADAD